MSAITKSQFITLIDKFTAAALCNIPSVLSGATSSTTPGWGDNTIAFGSSLDYGMQRKMRDAEVLIVNFDPINPSPGDLSVGMLPAVRTAQSVAPYQRALTGILGGSVTALAQQCAQAGISGVSNIDQYASYFNTGLGGNWQAMLPPDFVNIYKTLLTVSPNPLNVYAPPDINSPGRGVYNGTTFVPGSALNLALYAGWSFIFGVCTTQFTAPAGPGPSSSSSSSGQVTSYPNILLSANGVTANGTVNTATPYTGTFNQHELIYAGSYGVNITVNQVIVFAFSNAADMVQALTGIQVNGYTGGQMYFIGMSPTAAPSGAPAGLVGTSVPAGTTRTSPPV